MTDEVNSGTGCSFHVGAALDPGQKDVGDRFRDRRRGITQAQEHVVAVVNDVVDGEPDDR